jgi:uncharacterized paraquat-inducible protein A
VTAQACGSCGRPAGHLFPVDGAAVCSRCYEGLHLHARGPLWTVGGYAAMALGALFLLLGIIGFALLVQH